ncbi:MAG: ABC transporter substrate-binding protein [Ilumatobacter sp.]|nr:ABC transporter substrate-binding protein [Ilumatobacter sp.]
MKGPRRRVFAGLAAVMLVTASCASDDEPVADESDTTTGTSPATQPPEDETAEQPASTTAPTETTEATQTTDPGAPEDDGPAGAGGTLVVAISDDPGQYNPALTTSGSVHTASELMFSGLVSYDDDYAPQPDLALSWEIEDDGALYRFALRDDVAWHDGTPFTSNDVKFTFENVLTEFHSRTKASVGALLVSVDTPDDTTVEFRFSEPYAPLLQQLDVTEAPILPAHIYANGDIEGNPANLEPVGTGPFMFGSRTPDEEIVLVKNPDYFEDGLPILDEVVMRVIPDAGSQVLALESGEVDWLWGVPGPDLERFRNDDRYGTLDTLVNPGGANCIMTVSFNLDRAIFQDVQVRRAIAHALDREAFVERVAFGQGNAATAPISSGIPTAHADGLDLPDFDPDEAARLLDEAGWVRDGDGVRTAQGVDGVDDGTPLRFGVHLFPNFAPYGELMKALLIEIGVDLEINALERATMVEQVFTDRNFDTNVISYCNGTDPEVGIRRMYISGNIAPIPFSNSSGYVNTDVDALFDEARNTVDPAARAEVYRTLQEILVDELPYYWLVETTSTRVFTAECSGFKAFGHFAESASCSRE